MKYSIIGATGSVGIELLNLLLNDNVDPDDILLLAGSDNIVNTVQAGDLNVYKYHIDLLKGVQIVYVAVSGTFSSWEIPLMLELYPDLYVIDNSSHFRYHINVPLVIPEINGNILKKTDRLIANPNCSTAIASMILYPIHKRYLLNKVISSSYQAVSGAGKNGMSDLMVEMRGLQDNVKYNNTFTYPIALNVIPKIDSMMDNGYTKEEMKMSWEMKKIFDANIDVSATCVRVPTMRSHCLSLTIECLNDVSVSDIHNVLKGNSNVVHTELPMPIYVSKNKQIHYGRVRQSLIFGKKGIDLFVCGDQLLRGASLNAFLIGKNIIEKFLN